MLNLSLWLFLMFAQPSPDPFLSRLAGNWAGAGTVLGTEASVRLSWEWALDGQFLRLTFGNQMGPRQFDGHAYYRALGNGAYRGMWFDSSGMMRPIEGRVTGDALVARWGTPETEEGETTYAFRADGGLEITDRVRGKDGTWRTFGTVSARRAPR